MSMNGQIAASAKTPRVLAVLMAALLVMACGALASCGTSSDQGQQGASGEQAAEQDAQGEEAPATIPYTVSETTIPYTSGEEDGMGYRVAVSADATEEELAAVFDAVTADDGCGLHQVWFYSDERLTDGSAAYDVAYFSQAIAGAEPTAIMASEENKAAAQELLAGGASAGDAADTGEDAAQAEGADAADSEAEGATEPAAE